MVVRGFFQPWKTSAPRFVAAFVVAFAAAGALRAAGSRPASTTRLAAQSASVTSATHAAQGARATPGAQTTPAAQTTSAARAALSELGRKIFFDASLSEPAGTSCAGCHAPERGYSGDNGSKSGVPRGSRPGHFARRTAPSVLYLKFVHYFHFHWEEDTPLPDGVGGFFWDGRSDSLVSLIRQPLTNPDEMGNRDLPAIAEKARHASYAADLATQASGTDTEAVLTAMGKAVEAFLLSSEMAPFSSRYDAFVRGETALTAQESEGLRLFKDPAKGNCAFCHKLNDTIPKPERSPFSDFGFETVDVPRNRELGARATDLGLCERQEPEALGREARFCGSFRTPSLRNVALRPSYMHSGVFTRLRDVVAFYATRGTDPKRWYGAGGELEELPAKYRPFVNVEMSPYDRKRGETPRLDEHEIDAVVAFLETLNDTRIPGAPP